MRLTRENPQNKKDKKKLNKNKSVIEENPNIKTHGVNTHLQEKIRKLNREKALNQPVMTNKLQNTNIYKNNKKPHYKHNSQIKNDLDKNAIYTKNKTILNTNNNINIGNNINIITNNHIHENTKNNNENKMQNNIIDNKEIITDYNMSKKSSNDFYNNNINKIINPVNNSNNNNRINRINEGINMDKKFKNKNISMEHRYSRFSNDIVMSDGDLMDDDNNYQIRRNHIYSNPYKFNSPSTANNSCKHQFNLENINNYYYNKDIENLADGRNTFYNNFYKVNFTKKYNNVNNKRNKFNSVVGYNNQFNKYNYSNDIQNRTSNSFYTHKNPLNPTKNNNLITNRDYSNEDYNYLSYLNYINNNREYRKNMKYKGRYHSMIEENDIAISPNRNFVNINNNNFVDNNNNMNNYKSIRRSKNKIRIVKKNNNTSIQEYNLSLGEDNDDLDDMDNLDNLDNFQSEFTTVNNRRNNNQRINDSQKYFNHFTQNVQPITNNQFNIDSKINLTNDNYSNSSNNKTITTSIKKRNPIINNESNINNSKSSTNLLNTPNFSESGKTPKRPNIINNLKVKPFNNNDANDNIYSNSINNSNYEDSNPQYKILVKKRPKNDIPIPSGNIKKRNSASNSVNKNANKFHNFEICQNDKINFINNEKENNESKKKDDNDEKKFMFDNENEIIDYIFNKFEEERKKKSYFNRKLRFTGFVLSKKYKGKNLYEIRIEDDIEKINQQIKDENIVINEKQVEFKFISEEKEKENISKPNVNNNDINKELEEEIQKLKLENEKLNKKDSVKNELIKKLDNEKQKYIEEIGNMKNEIDGLKELNNKLIQEKNIINKEKEYNKINYEIENNIIYNINSNHENKINDENEMNNNESKLIDKISINSINNNNCSIVNDNNENYNNNFNNYSNDMVNYINENTNYNEEETNQNKNQNLLNKSKDISDIIMTSKELNENSNIDNKENKLIDLKENLEKTNVENIEKISDKEEIITENNDNQNIKKNENENVGTNCLNDNNVEKNEEIKI